MPLGSPPRVRSRHHTHARHLRQRGITSACAEQTPVIQALFQSWGDHLRVCGADSSIGADVSPLDGSPPRVRSRPPGTSLNDWCRGITSACAEQTGRRLFLLSRMRDHLRVCGADDRPQQSGKEGQGSPPRVRSRPGEPERSSAAEGITSACAEQTRI